MRKKLLGIIRKMDHGMIMRKIKFMKPSLTNNEVKLLKRLRLKFKRNERKWTTNCLEEKDDLFSRNRYEGISIGYHWAQQDIENMLERMK